MQIKTIKLVVITSRSWYNKSSFAWINRFLQLDDQQRSCKKTFLSNLNLQWDTLVKWPTFFHIYTVMINTLRPRQDDHHFPNDIFKCIFLNENVLISNKIPVLVQILAWHRPGHKPLSEPMMVSFLTHICVTRPQWVEINMYYVT